jgi:hypothetical protein
VLVNAEIETEVDVDVDVERKCDMVDGRLRVSCSNGALMTDTQ